MAYSRLEQETIILFNEAEVEAQVYTYNGSLTRKLGKMSLEFPADVKFIDEVDGAVTYKLPKSLIMVRKPHSEEYREAARARALANNLRPPRRELIPMNAAQKASEV